MDLIQMVRPRRSQPLRPFMSYGGVVLLLGWIGALFAIRPTLPMEPPVASSKAVPLTEAIPLAKSSGHTPALEPMRSQKPRGPTPTPLRGWIPQRIVIPAIRLDAPVVPVGFQEIRIGDQTVRVWETPNFFAAGWHRTSAPLGVPGNTVLNGHHNIYGEVFRDLVRLKPGDRVLVHSEGRAFAYEVQEKHLLPERGRPLPERLANARWIQPTPDERLTLITCWPYTSNTHRLIVIARPVSLQPDERKLQE